MGDSDGGLVLPTGYTDRLELGWGRVDVYGMEPMKRGTKVRAKKDHGHVKKGDVGVIREVHSGTFFGVMWPGATEPGFCPPGHVEPTPDPSPTPEPTPAALDYDDIRFMKHRR